MVLSGRGTASREGVALLIRFEKARVADAVALTEVQRRTFDDDSNRFGGLSAGGPPGYDSVDWTLWAIKTGIYYKILAGDRRESRSPGGVGDRRESRSAGGVGDRRESRSPGGVGDQIIGGVILFDMHQRHFNLGRIFVDPDWQDRGIGTQAIQFIEKTFPYVKRWSLDTPEWAVRNHHFYEKLGYVRVGEEVPPGVDMRLYLYEKRIP